MSTVEDLAAVHGVKMEEVRRFTEMVMAQEEDALRERRIRELAKRVSEGSYQIEEDELLDMAERRSIADRSGTL